MKQSSSSPRKTSRLSEALHRQLNMYTIAASAAGVSALALARSAEAKIIYTPAHVKIGFGGVSPYQLDLNHDGIPDFTISAYLSVTGGPDVILRATRYGSSSDENKVLVVKTAGYYSAPALRAGQRIGPARKFFFIGFMASSIYQGGSTFLKGPWTNVRNRYLGLRFQYGGKTHYGWARLSVRAPGHLKLVALLTGYAYETIPNKPIIAGQTKGQADDAVAPASLTTPIPCPATLGLLAVGSPELSIWRRREPRGEISCK